MKTNKKRKGLFARVGAFVLTFAVLLFSIVSATSSSTTASALDYNGIPVDNVDYITGYHMYMSLNGVTGTQIIPANANFKAVDALYDFKDIFSRSTYECSFIIEFPNIKPDGENRHFAIFKTIKIEMGSRFWGGTEIVFKNENPTDISLTNNIYKGLKSGVIKPDYSDITFTVYNSHKSNLISLDTNTRKQIINSIVLKEIPEEISKIDPESPDFDPNFGGNGDSSIIDGSDKDPGNNSSGCANVDLNMVYAILLIIGIVIGIGLLIRFIFWVFGT